MTETEVRQYVIPEAAPESAGPWITGFLERRGMALRGDEARVLARYVIEAAAPHMLAQAKADAWDEGATSGLSWNENLGEDFDAPNPYRPTR